MRKINTIGLVIPAAGVRDFSTVNEKISDLEQRNFKVKKFYKDDFTYGYFSDTDQNRLNYFHQAFLDPEVDLVLAVRGGFGAVKFVDKLDYSIIKDKYFAGASDITILEMALYKNTNVKCFHSLMLINGFSDQIKENVKIIENDIFKLDLTPLKKGNAKGILWGGNLSSMISLLGGETYLPNEDIILFLEDLNEPIYKLDKMLYQIYRNKKLLEKIKGIIFGDFYFSKEEITPLLNEYVELFNVPSYLSFDITHRKNNITIPFGKYIELN